MTRRSPIPSAHSPAPHNTMRRPYDRLRRVIAKAETQARQKEQDMKILEMLDEPEVKLAVGAQMVRDLIRSGKTAVAFEATVGEANALRPSAKEYASKFGYSVSICIVRTDLTNKPTHAHRYNLVIREVEK